MIFENVHPVLFAAFDCDPGTDDLGESVDVVGADPGIGLDPFTHLLGPGFGAEDARLERKFAHVDAAGRRLFDHEEEVRGSAADRGGSEVAHQHDLALRIAAGSGNHRRAERLGSVVGAESTGEEAVAVGDLNHIGPVESAAGEGALHHLHPHFEVLPGVGDDNRFPGGAAGSVQTDNVRHRTGEKAERIGVAQIRLDHKRQFAQIRQRTDVVGGKAAFLHAVAEKFDMLVGVFHNPLQAVELEIAQIIFPHVVQRTQIVVQVKRTHFFFLTLFG